MKRGKEKGYLEGQLIGKGRGVNKGGEREGGEKDRGQGVERRRERRRR